MTHEEFKALVNDALEECNRVDHENMQYGDEGMTALLGVMVHVVGKYPPDNARARAAMEWIQNRANEWRARNENSN